MIKTTGGQLRKTRGAAHHVMPKQDKENATERIFGLWKKRETRFSFCWNTIKNKKKQAKERYARREEHGQMRKDREL